MLCISYESYPIRKRLQLHTYSFRNKPQVKIYMRMNPIHLYTRFRQPMFMDIPRVVINIWWKTLSATWQRTPYHKWGKDPNPQQGCTNLHIPNGVTMSTAPNKRTGFFVTLCYQWPVSSVVMLSYGFVYTWITVIMLTNGIVYTGTPSPSVLSRGSVDTAGQRTTLFVYEVDNSIGGSLACVDQPKYALLKGFSYHFLLRRNYFVEHFVLRIK